MPRRSASLYIRPIPDECSHDDLRRSFGRYGHVSEVTIPVDYHSGRMKGFAFVEFDDSRDAEDAHKAMDRSRFMGRTIDVQFTRGYKKTPAEMQSRDRWDGGRRRRRSRSRSRDRYRKKSMSRSRSRSPVNGYRSKERRRNSRSVSAGYRERSVSRSRYQS